MIRKLFWLFSGLSMGFVLIIQAFNMRDTSEPITQLVMLGLFLSVICAALALIAHKWSS
jgi:hypothetical protein